MWTRCTRTSPQEFSTSHYTILQSPQLLKGVMRCCVAAEARTNNGGFCRQVWIRYHIRRYICSQSAIGNADGQILGSRKVCNLLLGDRVKMWLPPIISVMVLHWCVMDSGGKLSGIHLRCKRDVSGAVELWYLVVFRACWVITNRAAVLLPKKKKVFTSSLHSWQNAEQDVSNNWQQPVHYISQWEEVPSRSSFSAARIFDCQ